MAWTTPGTATAGEVLTAAFWNSNVRDNTQQLRDDRGAVFIASESFSAAASVTVSDCFTTDYRAYEIVFEQLFASANQGVRANLRGSGTTDTSSNYVTQSFYANDTVLTGTRSAATTFWGDFGLASTINSGASFTRIINPAATARTTYLTTALYRGGSNAQVWVTAGDLATSTAYDSLVLTPATGTISGRITVYGWAYA